jgi:hypothetical protein
MASVFGAGGLPVAVSWPGGSWQDTLKIVAAVLLTYLAVLWVAGLIWVYRDIRNRTRDPFYHALAVFLVLCFNLPGLWLYLILRPSRTLRDAYEAMLEEEALLQELEDQKGCPTCHRRVLDDYIVCPSCTTQLKEPCQSCGKPLSYSWVACPFCATMRSARARPEENEAQTQQLRGRLPVRATRNGSAVARVDPGVGAAERT